MSNIFSFFSMKCPNCKEGRLFETGSFSFSKPFDMYDHCPKCNYNYAPEPGFYYGAMFVGYIFTGWFAIVFASICVWVLGISVNTTFVMLIAVFAFLFVWFFRLARSLWLHIHHGLKKV